MRRMICVWHLVPARESATCILLLLVSFSCLKLWGASESHNSAPLGFLMRGVVSASECYVSHFHANRVFALRGNCHGGISQQLVNMLTLAMTCFQREGNSDNVPLYMHQCNKNDLRGDCCSKNARYVGIVATSRLLVEEAPNSVLLHHVHFMHLSNWLVTKYISFSRCSDASSCLASFVLLQE